MKLNLKEIREKIGISQIEMAERMNISQSTYARFERENTKIDLQRLDSFAKVVNMTVIDVIAYPDKYINIANIGELINQSEPEVIVQMKVTKSKREQILKTIFGDSVEILKVKNYG